jgi:hypothetical protein
MLFAVFLSTFVLFVDDRRGELYMSNIQLILYYLNLLNFLRRILVECEHSYNRSVISSGMV